MESSINYDPDEHLFSPSADVASQVLSEVDSPIFFYGSSTDTQSSAYPYQNSNNSSPPQLTPYSPNLSIDTVGSDSTKNETNDVSLTTESIEQLQILAQPKAFYRERYCSETDPSKHRAQRFIRTDDALGTHEYPTVEIPEKWRDTKRDLYIRVALVTVVSETVNVICIHPYAIDTPDADVFRDSFTNSLYFPITQEDVLNGEKSFRISRKKMIQHDLRSYGPLRLFHADQSDIQRVKNSHDAKQIIETYQLWKSQLIFAIAERCCNHYFPIPINSTSIISQIMCDKSATRTGNELFVSDKIPAAKLYDDKIKFAPRKGEWSGGDDVLMVIPKLDKRKALIIYFDYGSIGRLDDIQVSFVDTKTIFFQTPPCPMLITERNLSVPIIITQNDIIIGRVDFLYLTPIKTTINICSRCQYDIMNNNIISNKRRYFLYDRTETDDGESIVQQMNRLTTEDKHIEITRRIISDGKVSKFDKYLGQLQDALAEFVRTNDPSKLFRRTRLLIGKYDQGPPPLDIAIRNGYHDLALKLIEQAVDMPASVGLLERQNVDGETPLLLAAKINHWDILKFILEKRLDLAAHTDNNGNNILHILANLSDSKANETIKNVLLLLPDDTKTGLLQQKNNDNQTPMDIAQSKNDTDCVEVLKEF